MNDDDEMAPAGEGAEWQSQLNRLDGLLEDANLDGRFDDADEGDQEEMTQ